MYGEWENAMKISFIAIVEDDDGTKYQYDMPEIERVPERLRLLRMRTGLSQKAVADFVGMRKQAVQAWEAGHSLPSAEHLAVALHCLTRAAESPGHTPAVVAAPEPVEVEPAKKPVVTIRAPAGTRRRDVHQQIDQIFGALRPLAND
jgi:transcriptional regulator with XRE-family HTH domain